MTAIKLEMNSVMLFIKWKKNEKEMSVDNTSLKQNSMSKT